MKKIFAIFLAFIIAQSSYGDCVPLRYDQFESLLQKEREIEVIFFASWCVSCKKYFLKRNETKRVFVAVFDDKESAEKVIQKFQIQDQCFMDDGIAKQLAIKSLPHVRMWKGGSFLQ